MKFKYTVCFLKQDDHLLMLNREKTPIMGAWNGVGGKLEEGELPDAAAKREVMEETGIIVDSYFSKATIYWETSCGDMDGLHVYLFEVDSQVKFETPKKIKEGILDWKPIDWVLDPNNLGIPEKVPQYLPHLLKHEGSHVLHYKDGQMIKGEMVGKQNAEIDEYILQFPPAVQEKLKTLRKVIREAAPEASETISYRMPAFALHGILVYFAAYKNHIGFYPTASGIQAFKHEIKGYKNSKGAVQFPLNEPLPVELISEMVKFRVAENQAKAELKKKK